jgi:hypothetical protein
LIGTHATLGGDTTAVEVAVIGAIAPVVCADMAPDGVSADCRMYERRAVQRARNQSAGTGWTPNRT